MWSILLVGVLCLDYDCLCVQRYPQDKLYTVRFHVNTPFRVCVLLPRREDEDLGIPGTGYGRTLEVCLTSRTILSTVNKTPSF